MHLIVVNEWQGASLLGEREPSYPPLLEILGFADFGVLSSVLTGSSRIISLVETLVGMLIERYVFST